MSTEERRRNLEWLEAEPFTLVLSAGFFGFYAHTGVISALEIAGLRPRRVVGTSAGAISGGIWASGASSDEMERALSDLRRRDFWDPSWAPSSWGREDPGTPLGLLRGRKLDQLLQDLVGVSQVEDCPTELAIVTHELRARRTHVHERGPLRAAIRASAALPLMFGPVRIGERLHADGGISDRPGFSALASHERCLYHHLPHQSRWPRVSGHEGVERQSLGHRRVLVFDDLPRVHPLALERGPDALRSAREQTLRWLEMPA